MVRRHPHLTQKEHEEPEGIGQADLKEITVEFPPGLVINPAGANCLDANRARVRFVGHNGKAAGLRPALRAQCRRKGGSR